MQKCTQKYMQKVKIQKRKSKNLQWKEMMY